MGVILKINVHIVSKTVSILEKENAPLSRGVLALLGWFGPYRISFQGPQLFSAEGAVPCTHHLASQTWPL